MRIYINYVTKSNSKVKLWDEMVVFPYTTKDEIMRKEEEEEEERLGQSYVNLGFSNASQSRFYHFL